MPQHRLQYTPYRYPVDWTAYSEPQGPQGDCKVDLSSNAVTGETAVKEVEIGDMASPISRHTSGRVAKQVAARRTPRWSTRSYTLQPMPTTTCAQKLPLLTVARREATAPV